jgi:hypothetical protein
MSVPSQRQRSIGDRLPPVIQLWRHRRRLRRLDARERKIIARETLRDFKQISGDEFGPPGGGY